MRGLIHKTASFAARSARSKRVRAFFALSVAVHAGLALWLANSPSSREWLFGSDKPQVGKIEDAQPYEIRAAIETLLELHRERLRNSARQLASVRLKINDLQETKLARMKAEDIEARKVYDAVAATRPVRDPYRKRIDVDPPKLSLPPLPPLEGLDLVELYNLHKPLEQQAAKAYERARALRLAELPDDPIPLSKALGVSPVPLPARKEVDRSKLDTKITTLLDGKFAALKQELNETSLEAENMVTTARQWLDEATKAESKASTLLGENVIRYVPPPTPYYGEIINKKYLRQTDLKRTINPMVSLGNRIDGDAGIKTEWMAIDKWYYIGPFTYAGASARLDVLDRKFPPETEINLDASYPRPDGKPDKDGKPAKLEWRYRRMGDQFLEQGIRVEPYLKDNGAYCVWYFYTEVYSDRDREVLTSFASDDYGMCRINGQKIYESPPETFPWVPFHQDSFKKVKLKKGYNTVLFKLENARGTTGFSVIMQVDPDSATPPKDIKVE